MIIDKLTKNILYAYLIWSFIRYSLTFAEKNTWWIIPYISPLTSLIEPLFILVLWFNLFIVITRLKLDKNLWLLCYFTLAVFFISVGSNTLQIVNSLKFFGGYYKFIPLFLLSGYITKKEEISLRSLLGIIIGLLAFQFFLNFFWFLDIQLLNNTRALIPGNPDWAYGTMENTHMLAVTFVIVFAVGFFLIRKGDMSSKIFGFTLLLCGIIQVAWSESKANFITIGLTLAILSFLASDKKIPLKQLIYVIGLFAGFFLIASITYSDLGHFSNSSEGILANIEYFWGIVKKTWQYNYKVQFINTILFDIQKDFGAMLVGTGPGTLGSNFAIENPTALSEAYFIPLIEANFNLGNSILLNPQTGFTAILGDLGWLGFLSYFGFHFFLLCKIIIKFRKGQFRGRLYKIGAMIWIALMINYLLNNILKDILYIGAPVTIIWILGGVLLFHIGNNIDYKIVKLKCTRA